MAHYLLVIGERTALGWVLSEQKMAFPDFRRSETRRLAAGDTLFLYTTRGCFGNPTRDRGRVIAKGTATTAVSALDDPVELGGRTFPVGCDVRFTKATKRTDGVELGPLVPELSLFNGAEQHWSIRLRRPLVELPQQDASLLDQRLAEHQPKPLRAVLDDYAQWWRAATG